MSNFLAQCVRLQGDESYYQQLAQQMNDHTDWTLLASQAEEHGLGPLLYKHLQTMPISPPSAVKLQLQGLYLRHRFANQVRAEVLTKILALYKAHDIQALILKGSALAHLVYPHPGLRPMRDIDLLVEKSRVREAYHLLTELGFETPLVSSRQLPDKHMPTATLPRQGFCISVEVHHNLFNKDFPASMDIGSLTSKPLTFSLNGLVASTLGYEDMLWHLCQHLAYHANVWEALRFIWITDIVSFAERFAACIDWEQLEHQYPLILKTLSLLHFLIPLSDELLAVAPIQIGSPPQGIGQDFEGWPRSSLAAQRSKGYGRILYDTFFPSEWWLRLHYGLGSADSLWKYRWFYYPIHILARFKQLAQEQKGLTL